MMEEYATMKRLIMAYKLLYMCDYCTCVTNVLLYMYFS